MYRVINKTHSLGRSRDAGTRHKRKAHWVTQQNNKVRWEYMDEARLFRTDTDSHSGGRGTKTL